MPGGRRARLKGGKPGSGSHTWHTLLTPGPGPASFLVPRNPSRCRRCSAGQPLGGLEWRAAAWHGRALQQRRRANSSWECVLDMVLASALREGPRSASSIPWPHWTACIGAVPVLQPSLTCTEAVEVPGGGAHLPRRPHAVPPPSSLLPVCPPALFACLPADGRG